MPNQYRRYFVFSRYHPKPLDVFLLLCVLMLCVLLL
ncbi:Uncharacterised protein [Vibrio cholerae]|nr:Uncharacterised protein [Vibrio cholerae]